MTKKRMEVSRWELAEWLFTTFIIGIAMGQIWACAQFEHRREMCQQYGLYCEDGSR